MQRQIRDVRTDEGRDGVGSSIGQPVVGCGCFHLVYCSPWRLQLPELVCRWQV